MTLAIPVLLVPANLTKHLKVTLDNAGWRDKTKLITRYSQILARSGGPHESCQHTGYDLTLYMAMALLPISAFNTLPSTEDRDPTSLWTLLQGPSSPISSLEWPSILTDPEILKSIFMVKMDPSAFTTPKHLLVQTPLEKLQQSTEAFLTPYLQSWSTSDEQSADAGHLSLNTFPHLIASLPQKWEHYSTFTLLPPTAFLIEPWPTVLKRLENLDRMQGHRNAIMAQWEKLVQEALQSSHIARKAIIPVQDVLRRPKIRPLTGDWKIHNRYKSWFEDDHGLLEHQHVESATHDSMEQTKQTDLYDENNVPTEDDFKDTYWAETCQNHVWYSWAPMFTMFSAGNITEKERIANSRPIFDARGKIIVDLYVGIGYFSLVYLVHAGAKTVHACEWNPWSVKGLVRGAEKNDIEWKQYHSRVPGSSNNDQPFTEGKKRIPIAGKKPKEYGNLVIYPGDNAQWIEFFENQAHHVNLGLIPSAEPGWVLGVRALSPTEGGYLHVHHNIRVGEEETFKKYLLQSLQGLFMKWKVCKKALSHDDEAWSIDIRHMENVKSFAPMVFHYVIDVECRPPQFIRLERTNSTG
ncbi:tRNA methyltransferase tyw3 [Haplosporangium sp. Z 767]|nr:tRNA methyltransferase tyw3 [Haplosporangium sp. Z 767]